MKMRDPYNTVAEVWRVVIACTALFGMLNAADIKPDISTITMPEGTNCTGYLSTDINGDGLIDVVLATYTPSSNERHVQLHHQNATGSRFFSTPTNGPYRIERDVVAFTVADVLPTPMRELILITSDVAVAVTYDAQNNPSYTTLGRQSLVWPVANPIKVMPLSQAVYDADQSGSEDILLPQANGAVLLLNPAVAELSRQIAFIIPESERNDSKTKDFEIEISYSDALKNKPLLQVKTNAPLVSIRDLDGDGMPELLAVHDGQLFVRRLTDSDNTPLSIYSLPMPADRLRLAPSSIAWFATKGQSGPDILLTTSAKRNGTLETRVDRYRALTPTSWDTTPTSRLRFGLLNEPPIICDADGDGQLDVVTVTFIGESGESDKSNNVPLLLSIFRGEEGRFRQPAWLRARMDDHEVQFSADERPNRWSLIIAGTKQHPNTWLHANGLTLDVYDILVDGKRGQLTATAHLAIPNEATGAVIDTARREFLIMSKKTILMVRLP